MVYKVKSFEINVLKFCISKLYYLGYIQYRYIYTIGFINIKTGKGPIISMFNVIASCYFPTFPSCL